jgi:hypothetical protein
MNFKKPKIDVINEAQTAAMGAMFNQLNMIKNGSVSSVAESIGYMVTYAIDAAIVSLVNNIYTDQEFEEDLTLRDKT